MKYEIRFYSYIWRYYSFIFYRVTSISLLVFLFVIMSKSMKRIDGTSIWVDTLCGFIPLARHQKRIALCAGSHKFISYCSNGSYVIIERLRELFIALLWLFQFVIFDWIHPLEIILKWLCRARVRVRFEERLICGELARFVFF